MSSDVYDVEMANPPTRADFDTASDWLDDAGRRRLANPTVAEMRAIYLAMKAEEPATTNTEIIRRLGISASQFYRDVVVKDEASATSGEES